MVARVRVLWRRRRSRAGRDPEQGSAAVVDVEALFREHDQYLHRVLRRRFDASVPTAVIEDACASAWAIAWAHRDRVLDENPVGWLVTVAWRETLALLRKRRVEASSAVPLTFARDGDPEAALEPREGLELVAQLGPNQRLAVGLQAGGFGYQEIAELTGKTYTWTNRHVSEGRARLRALAAAD
jgi:DNA-directed RNA polymerase specialized sigma24 family protein